MRFHAISVNLWEDINHSSHGGNYHWILQEFLVSTASDSVQKSCRLQCVLCVKVLKLWLQTAIKMITNVAKNSH